MAIHIIDLFKVIDIHHQKCLFSGAFLACDPAFHFIFQSPAVKDTGQLIDPRIIKQGFLSPPVHDSDHQKKCNYKKKKNKGKDQLIPADKAVFLQCSLLRHHITEHPLIDGKRRIIHVIKRFIFLKFCESALLLFKILPEIIHIYFSQKPQTLTTAVKVVFCTQHSLHRIYHIIRRMIQRDHISILRYQKLKTGLIIKIFKDKTSQIRQIIRTSKCPLYHSVLINGNT